MNDDGGWISGPSPSRSRTEDTADETAGDATDAAKSRRRGARRAAWQEAPEWSSEPPSVGGPGPGDTRRPAPQPVSPRRVAARTAEPTVVGTGPGTRRDSATAPTWTYETPEPDASTSTPSWHEEGEPRRARRSAGSGRGRSPATGGTAVQWDRPFARLALTHALSVGGDAVVAIALAQSLFFSVDPSESRVKVLLYLVFTMAPFALVGSLLGPAMDRLAGGHRMVIVASTIGRAVLAFAMVREIDDSLLLFPEAFMALVLGKTYAVAKSSMVPSTVNSDADLVEANSKLQLLSGLAGFVLGVPAGLLSLIGPAPVLIFASCVFVAGSIAAVRIHPAEGSLTDEAHHAGARLEGVHSAVVRVASSAMSWLRCVVGLVTFMLAFVLRSPPPSPPIGASVGTRVGFIDPAVRVGSPPEVTTGYPAWFFGVVVAASIAGGLAGSVLAPRLRAVVKEERIMLGGLIGSVLAGLLGLLFPGLLGMVLLSITVAISAGVAKQAFDSLVQAGAPDANRGQLFARFEARFQVVWVLGAVLAVLLRPSVGVGSAIVFVGSIVALVMYRVGWSNSGGLPVRKPRARVTGVLARDELIGGARSALRGLWNLQGSASVDSDPRSDAGERPDLVRRDGGKHQPPGRS